MDRTIAAISTAYGESGIGIVRMSGPEAERIAKKFFLPGGIRREGFEFIPRFMHYGAIADPKSGAMLDEALCVFMKAPGSYTGEDMVEIQCHGSLVSLKNILSLCLALGAEPAEKGEFTKLAFLNGRMDLAQAEAVIDLIKARTGKSFDAALSQMKGSLSARVKDIRAELMDLLVLLTVNIDYPDEDIEEATYDKIVDSLSTISDDILKLLDRAEEGKILREGIGIAIVGRPNVGKSSLMNLLLMENRSIVTDIPGTTRDTIEEQLSLRGIPVRLTDTAGIHSSQDAVEALGIERSKQAFNKADVVLLILDSSRPLKKEDKELIDALENRPCVAVLNKSDLPAVLKTADIQSLLPQAKIVSSSLINDDGVEEIKDALEALISGGAALGKEDILVSNTRHAQLLKKALEDIQQAMTMAINGEALDFIEVSANSAFSLLGEITGDTASGEIIDEVFSRFCLGK